MTGCDETIEVVGEPTAAATEHERGLGQHSQKMSNLHWRLGRLEPSTDLAEQDDIDGYVRQQAMMEGQTHQIGRARRRRRSVLLAQSVRRAIPRAIDSILRPCRTPLGRMAAFERVVTRCAALRSERPQR